MPSSRVVSVGVVLSAFSANCGMAGTGSQSLLLVKDGKAKATVVLGTHPSDAERAAAQEIQTCIFKMTSGDGHDAEKLPIETEAKAPASARIFVGRNRYLEEWGISLDYVGAEGFIIQTVDRGLVLCGKDDAGTEFAVYTFLEKYCGARWFWPGESGEHIPHLATLEIGYISEKQEPDFGLRLFGKDALWKKRNKLGGTLRFTGGHNEGRMVPPAEYGPVHPEYFALVKGKRERDWNGYDGQHGYHLCTSNPEVIRVCVDHVRKFFDEHPEIDVFSVAPNDGGGFCECDRCRALDTGKRMPDGKTRILSDRIYTFTNEIATGVKTTHPGKYVAQFAYQSYIEPPSRVRPLDNVIVMLTVNCEGNYATRHQQNHWRLLREWSALTHNLYVYEYFMHTWKPQLPRAMIKALGEAIPFYRQCEASLFFAQSSNDFAMEGLDYYITAKLLWDASLDVDAIVDDYCRKAFGGAAGIMKKFFYRLEELWAAAMRTQDYWQHGSGNSAGNPDDYLMMFTPETMAELKAYLIQALPMAQTREHQERVRFVLQGWRFTELEVKAFRSLRGLAHKGIIDYQEGASAWKGRVANLSTLDVTEADARRLISGTIAAWEERDRYAHGLRDSCVIDVGQMKSRNCLDARFHPVARLKAALAQ